MLLAVANHADILQDFVRGGRAGCHVTMGQCLEEGHEVIFIRVRQSEVSDRSVLIYLYLRLRPADLGYAWVSRRIAGICFGGATGGLSAAG